MKKNYTLNQPSIVFFMLVTNRDVYIADYSIRSYRKLKPALENYNWKLVIYLNCLKNEFKNKYSKKWNDYDYTEIIDNSEFIDAEKLIPGQEVIDDYGNKSYLEGKFERGCAVWEREFRKFESDYWATVDADFEIISPDFILEGLKQLEQNKNLAVFSSDSGSTDYKYDSYSDGYIIAMKRHNTWFCIYKRECQICMTSHFYYEEEINGERYSYDDAAKFQFDLEEKYGYGLLAATELNNVFRYSFIHYGAFSKNDSLDGPIKIYIYRCIIFLSRRGLIFLSPTCIINKCFQFLGKALKIIFYYKINKERRKYHYVSKLDK